MTKSNKFIYIIFFISFFFISGLSVPAEASGDLYRSAQDLSRHSLLYDSVAVSLQEATGMAVSPILIMFAHGLYLNLSTPEGQRRPLHASPACLVIMGCFLLAVFTKDLAPLPAAIKSPLSAAEEALMPIGAVSGFIVVLPGLAAALEPFSSELAGSIIPLFQAEPAWAKGLAETAAPALTLVSVLGLILAGICCAIVYWVVWCVSNTINVLCIIAPGMAVPVLKLIRLLVLSCLVALTLIHPLLGLLSTLLLIAFCLLVVRWAFKLTVWGAILSFDLLGGRWRREPRSDRFLAFGGGQAKRLFGLPKRTCGFLYPSAEKLIFRYRRFLLFPALVIFPAKGLSVGRCLLSPVLMKVGANGEEKEIFTFPLRFRGHEEILAKTLGAEKIGPAGLKKQAGSAVDWLKKIWRNRNLDDCLLS